jgi:hypothetical protein
MRLLVNERLALLTILPAESNFLTMKIIANLRSDAGFSEQELTELNFHQENGNFLWDEEKDVGKEIEIGLKGRNIVYDALARLDEDGKIRGEHLSLCEKFEYAG